MIELDLNLKKGIYVNRYKRFFVDVQLESGEIVTAHCPNTGSMKSCLIENSTVHINHNPSPKRKLDYTWEFLQVQGGLIGINTHRPNAIVESAINHNEIPELVGYDTLKREVKYGENSRVDVLLSSPGKKDCYVEVKNVTLLDDGLIQFPDSKTTRGAKHLNELSEMVRQGHRSVMLFLINRPEKLDFRIADHIDPDYYAAYRAAKEAGVEMLAYQCESSLNNISISNPIRIVN